jgi:DNA repair photolyase
MLFHDLVPQLTTELAALPILPRAVVLGPDTDPFMPLAEVQADTVRAIEALAKHGIPSWVMTRGFIRPMAREVLVERRDLLRVTVGLSTLDRDLQRLVEPLAAPPRMRLRQIATLLGRGVSVRVELGPLVPGLTDTRANLSTLLDGLADVGVRQVTTSYMFSRPGIRDQMVRSLESLGLEDQVLEAFEGGPTVNLGGGPPVLLMPKARRQRGYATLMALAAGRGMTVSVNALTNPDFVPTRPAPVSLVPRLSRAHAG